MEWISLKVCPGSHFDGQGDVSHLPTRLAETEAPVLPLCPLRARSIPIGSRRILTCALQPPSDLSPLAYQSQKQTDTSTPSLQEKAHLLCQEAGGSTFPFLPVPCCIISFCSLQDQTLQSSSMEKSWNNPKTLLTVEQCFVENLMIQMTHIKLQWLHLELSFP